MIVGLYFPEYDYSFVENGHVTPGLLSVLPEGDNVIFCRNKEELGRINEEDVKMYVVSVYTFGFNKFVEWAKTKDKSKIIVGGYHATLRPEEFLPYARKIVTGNCDKLEETIAQSGIIVPGIVDNLKLPRFDIFKRTNLLNVNKNLKKTSVVTSIGCSYDCEFCCTPLMTGKKILRKSLEQLDKEIRYMLKVENTNYDLCFIQDENLLMLPDWRQRLDLMNSFGLTRSYNVFVSSSLLNNDKTIAELESQKVGMVILGIEDIDVNYAKNKDMYQAIKKINNSRLDLRCSFIVNPLELIDGDMRKAKFERYKKFLDFSNPCAIHFNVLAPYPGTRIHDKFKDKIDPYDYSNYGRVELYVKDQVLAQQIWNEIHGFQEKFYSSNEFLNRYGVIVRDFGLEQVEHEKRLLKQE